MTDESRRRFRAADAIFDAALDLAPDFREAFIANACGGDGALRAAVRQLLDAHRESRGFLEAPAAELVATLITDGPDALPAVPERVGAFRLIRELGRGGMGVVYLAEDEGADFSRLVAVKIMRNAGDGDAIVRRFAAERRILELLDHPAIARLVGGGTAGDGRPFLAMELVEGDPIDEWCDARQQPLTERIDLFAVTCDAVRYAHEQMVIHRDLKPSNILVRADGQVKLLDFGIAKLLDLENAPGDGDALQARSAEVALTPEYAAPEQVQGGAVSAATDIYALGVLLYCLLAGVRPYEVRGRPTGELVRLICEVVPPPPSGRFGPSAGVAARARVRGGDPDRLMRLLNGDLDRIVMKALEKEPSRRYSSVASLIEDLRLWRSGTPP